MKIALIADYYEPYLRDFTARCGPKLSSFTYRELQKRLFSEFFGSFVSYHNHLLKLGHDSELIVGNYFPLQQQWCQENQVPISVDRSTKKEVVARQIAASKPDAVLLGSMFDYYGQFLKVISSVTRNIFAWISCPHPPGLDLSQITCVLSSVPAFVDKFNKLNVKAELLKAAFDGDVLPSLKDTPKQFDLTFVGGFSEAYHQVRIKTVERLLSENFPLRIWGNYYYKNRLSKIWGRFFPAKIEKALQGQAWGIEMYRLLASSRISLNIHAECAQDNNMVGNMRLYEATGCGALLITDSGKDLDNLFVPSEEVVSFCGFDELADKVRYYLNHPDEASQIALAGQKACLQKHGYDRRVQELEKIFKTYCQ